MKNKGGRPAFEPTKKDREVVTALAGFGIPTDKIASVVGITKPTLLKVFAAEIARGTAQVEANLIGNLFKLASGNDGTALKAIIFSLQCRFGWSQYAPAPEPKPEPIGKKEQATLDAQTAHEESGWSELVH